MAGRAAKLVSSIPKTPIPRIYAPSSKMSSGSKITRWSLNTLAKLKTDLVDPQTSRVLTPFARDLARDVSLRLDHQKELVDRMEKYVNQNLIEGISGSPGEDQEQQDPNHTSNVTTDRDGKKVIACSTYADPSWWKSEEPCIKRGVTQFDPLREKMLKKASKNLHNLKSLHQSTYDVANGLFAHLEEKYNQGQSNPDCQFLDKKETKWIKAAMRQVRDRHALTVEDLAEFCITTRPYWESPQALDSTVMDFLRGRFGVQLLCEHYLAPAEAGHGIVCVDCHLDGVLDDAITEAKILCESNYSHLVTAAPEVIVVNQTIDRNDQFTIVRPWVHYVLVELLKNAMAVSMERVSSDQGLPPTIYISIDDHHEEGDEDKSFLSIAILDQGGGFPKPELMEKSDVLFGFVKTKTTMYDRRDDQQTYAMPSSPMQGLGVGLCLSRLSMQHFGGTVELKQHPPLSLCEQNAFREYELEKGCIASIKLLKDLDHPEVLFGDEE